MYGILLKYGDCYYYCSIYVIARKNYKIALNRKK